MLGVIITAAAGALLLWLVERLRQTRQFANELSRKSVHAVHAVVVASWPYFTSYKFIVLAELVFLAVVLIAHWRNLFGWLRQVSRKTWGEFFFPAGIILAALFNPPAWIFAVAMLNLGLADSLAAIVGKRWGKQNSFKLLNYKKSLAGLITFWLVSLLILTGFVLTHQSHFSGLGWQVLLGVPVILALLETVSVWGTDNLVVPLVTLLLLSPFA